MAQKCKNITAHCVPKGKAKVMAISPQPPITIAQLGSSPATLVVLDQNGNPLATQPTDAVAGNVWSDNAPVILTVVPTTPGNTFSVTVTTIPDPANPGFSLAGTTTLQVVTTYTDGSGTGPFTTTSVGITVPPGTPVATSAVILFGAPVTP